MPTEGFLKFGAAVEYISQNVSSGLAIDLMDRLRAAPAGLAANIDTVMDDVSTSGAGVFLSNGERRRKALRALILCQRVYLSELYLDASKIGDIPGGFPKATVSFWSSKSETEIKRGIEMYMRRPNATPADLIAAAATGPTPNLRLEDRVVSLTRDDNPFPVDPTCFRAVQSWLLKAGFVSLQWYLKNNITAAVVGQGQQNKGAELLRIFGPGTPVQVATDAAIPTNIPAGTVVYMYKANGDGAPNIFGALGHWMVSDGTGRGFGCNNSQGAADRPNNLYARCNITNQIQEMRPEGPSGNVTTFIRTYDPATIGG